MVTLPEFTPDTSIADRLRDTLQMMLDHYLELAVSGDAGNWDPELEEQIVFVRKQLAMSAPLDRPESVVVHHLKQMMDGLSRTQLLMADENALTAIDSLKDRGFVEEIEPDTKGASPATRQRRYRLTDLGRQANERKG